MLLFEFLKEQSSKANRALAQYIQEKFPVEGLDCTENEWKLEISYPCDAEGADKLEEFCQKIADPLETEGQIRRWSI